MNGQLASLDLSLPPPTIKGDLSQVRLTVPPSFLSGELASLSISQLPSFIVTVNIGTDLEPGVPNPVSANAEGGEDSVVTGYAWSAVGGTIVGTGVAVHVIPDPTYIGSNVTVTVTASGTGAAPGTGATTTNVLPHLEWIAVDGQWVPRILNAL